MLPVLAMVIPAMVGIKLVLASQKLEASCVTASGGLEYEEFAGFTGAVDVAGNRCSLRVCSVVLGGSFYPYKGFAYHCSVQGLKLYIIKSNIFDVNTDVVQDNVAFRMSPFRQTQSPAL